MVIHAKSNRPSVDSFMNEFRRSWTSLCLPALSALLTSLPVVLYYFGNANANANTSSSRRLWAAARASAAQNKQIAKWLSAEDITINRMYNNIISEITHSWHPKFQDLTSF